MPISKIGSKGVKDAELTADDLAPGTITSAKIAPGTIASDRIAPGTIANDRLANNSVTLNGTAVSLGGTADIGTQWQSVITSNTTMVAGRGYFVNTTSGAITMTLPASASAGDTIEIKDYAETFATNNLTIARNGHNIQGASENSEIKTNRASIMLVYVDATKGWLYTLESNISNLQVENFTSATGGTESTSGNYKIHTFNSSSNFVVTTADNQGNKVQYLVVAGGGGGGGPTGNWTGGGGGGGGHRTNYPNPDTTGITVTAQTYPITVGAGGTGNNTPAGDGSPSIFSTITSAGGGAGGTACVHGRPGGSGGGGGVGGSGNNAGSGNTPPVSPSQGNDGGSGEGNPGSGSYTPWGGGGGGGAGGTGDSGSPGRGGDGGNGTANSITGSSVTRAGGGGGGTHPGPAGFGSGGPGGGGRGAGNPGNATAGSSNTGGGGGGPGECSSQPGNIGQTGGSGVVILRYKYQ
jgi:hypothetical protein